MQRKKDHDVFKKDVEPDNELLLWENWVKIRYEEVIKLADNINRPPVDLTMNLLEKVREKKEWKIVLEHAQIEKKPKVRGQLWEQPQRLKQPCYCMPVYEVQRTAAEKAKPSVIMHVCVPPYIQKTEKGIFGEPERLQCVQLNADFNKYREKRESDLKKKIDKLDPFRPKDCLLVRGHRPHTPPPKLPLLPKINIAEMDKPRELALYEAYAIRINNTVIIKDIPGQTIPCLEKMKKEEWHEDCVRWYYYFNNPFNKAGRCKIFLQNLGTVSLRYCWKKLKRTIPFIPEDIYEQVFFFNKNEDVLSPGQKKEILFTFLSDRPGIYCESWELSFCNICFFDTLSEKLCVNLSADSVENVINIRKKFETLQHRIDKKAIFNIVTDIINDTIVKATTVTPQEYPYRHLFLEAEMFVMKNPVCFYHQTEVSKMRELYTEMCHAKDWDLSIVTWRKAMIEKEFDDRMKYYDLLKTSHADFLKPWYEGDDLLKQKRRVVNQLLGQMADKFDMKYNELVDFYTPTNQDVNEAKSDVPKNSPLTVIDPLLKQIICNVFYIHAYDYVCTTIEMCAGVLSSLDLNRWIEFDFCQV